MIYLKRALKAFVTSAVISSICLLIIELITRAFGADFYPMTPEFMNRFPSTTMALEVNIILYGIYGAGFAGMSFIYDIDRLGFVLQTILYAVATALIWVPIVTFTWQLHKYPQAFISTIAGFIATYVIMIVVSYKTVKKQVESINKSLETN